MRFGPQVGRYMMHCHNLVHEDHDMMVQFEVGTGGHHPIEQDRPKHQPAPEMHGDEGGGPGPSPSSGPGPGPAPAQPQPQPSVVASVKPKPKRKVKVKGTKVRKRKPKRKRRKARRKRRTGSRTPGSRR